MQQLNLAVIPGDGIGKEVIPQGLKVLTAALIGTGLEVNPTFFDLGSDRWLKTGQTLTEADLTALSQHDAILLGAIGDPKVPSGVLERGLLLKLRFKFDHYINLRPASYLPGANSPLANPKPFDFLVVREGSEGAYVGAGGAIRKGELEEVATEVSINTAHGVYRVIRYAFEQAAKRRQHLTLVHKHNVLVHAGDLYQRIFAELHAEFDQVEVDYQHIDAMMIHLVNDPSRFDVIVTDNLFGDILTDLAGAISGSIGLAASANLNPSKKFPSMFEPVHGSAPDIAGKQLADPTATVLSVALMLEFIGQVEAAAKIRAAVMNDLKAPKPLKRSTSQIGDDLVKALHELDRGKHE